MNDLRNMISPLLKPKDQTGAVKLSAHMWRKQKVEMWREWRAAGIYPLCHLCNKPITDILDFEPDHIIPRGMGGGSRDDRRENLAPAHSWCNRQRGSKRLPK